jgi:osmotically-inducible protein OsmY
MRASSLMLLVGLLSAGQTLAQEAAPPDPNAAVSERVKDALHANHFLLDRFIKVSFENGAVHLRGLVFSDWDLREAMRVASAAAKPTPVINELDIESGTLN